MQEIAQNALNTVKCALAVMKVSWMCTAETSSVHCLPGHWPGSYLYFDTWELGGWTARLTYPDLTLQGKGMVHWVHCLAKFLQHAKQHWIIYSGYVSDRKYIDKRLEEVRSYHLSTLLKWNTLCLRNIIGSPLREELEKLFHLFITDTTYGPRLYLFFLICFLKHHVSSVMFNAYAWMHTLMNWGDGCTVSSRRNTVMKTKLNRVTFIELLDPLQRMVPDDQCHTKYLKY